MKKVVKKNQIIVTSLAIMIAVAGFLNYTGTKITVQDLARITGNDETEEEYELDDNGELSETSASGSALVGDAEETNYQTYEDYLASEDYADFQDMDYAETSANTTDTADADEITEVPGEAVLTNTAAVDFAAEAKLNREQIRSKNKELLNEVINNTNISEESKQEAIKTMVSLTDIAEKENAAEMLLSAKGFENAVVSISDGNVDVVIAQSDLDAASVAQIQDVVKRKTGIPAENIVITPANGAEE